MTGLADGDTCTIACAMIIPRGPPHLNDRRDDTRYLYRLYWSPIGSIQTWSLVRGPQSLFHIRFVHCHCVSQNYYVLLSRYHPQTRFIRSIRSTKSEIHKKSVDGVGRLGECSGVTYRVDSACWDWWGLVRLVELEGLEGLDGLGEGLRCICTEYMM